MTPPREPPASTRSTDQKRPRRCHQPIWLRPLISAPGPHVTTKPGPDGLHAPLAADPIYYGAPIATNCKRLNCAECGPRRRAEIYKQIRDGFHTDEPLRFLTFTWPLATSYGATAEGVKAANRDFRCFVQELRRRRYVIEYAKVIEFTKRGRIHLHALTRGSFLPKCNVSGRKERGLPYSAGSGSPCYCSSEKPCLQALAWNAGFGFVDVRLIHDPEEAAGYIARYLTKTCGDERWPKWARRYTTSRRWASITLAGIHAEWVEQLRARHGSRFREPCIPPAVVIGWEMIPAPHNREHVIWEHGPPGRPLNFHYPHHLAGRLWNPETGEVLALPARPLPERQRH